MERVYGTPQQLAEKGNLHLFVSLETKWKYGGLVMDGVEWNVTTHVKEPTYTMRFGAFQLGNMQFYIGFPSLIRGMAGEEWVIYTYSKPPSALPCDLAT